MKEPMIQPPPDEVWLTHRPCQHQMSRTSEKDDGAIRYVRGDAYDEAIAYIERMVGENNADPISVLVDLRFALGDNGKLMISELVAYAAELRADAEKWRNLSIGGAKSFT